MRPQLNGSAALFLALLLTSFRPGTGETRTLTVAVDNFRNDKGIAQFALYNKEGSIPDERYRKYYRLQTAPISNGRSTAVFTDLPPGRYAVNVLHDENSNGKIDKGLMLPKEGIGFSNFNSIGLSNRPEFRKASFPVSADTSIRVKIIYM